MKLNIDGVAYSDSNHAGCGGLVQDENGRWLFGFTKSLGYCSAFIIECWGSLCGL